MKCPNCKIEMTVANEKVKFEDIDENSITLDLQVEWCLECGYYEYF